MSISTKKYEMTILDEGYEDPFWSKVEEERERINRQEAIPDDDEMEKFSFTDVITLKRIMILLAWGVLYYLFVYLGFGMMYL